MIKFENTEVIGWEAAIRGMRNPMNSWENSDSLFNIGEHGACDIDNLIPYRTGYNINGIEYGACADWIEDWAIGPNDYDLMKRLRNAGTDHRKFMRMITVYVDITAPLYWWKEFDTYKIGTVVNSCSTMHKIHEKEFTLEDFSCEYLFGIFKANLEDTILKLNYARNTYIYGGEVLLNDGKITKVEPKDKEVWWQMIQLLPSSYNQKRTVMLNYEVLANIYKSRKGHKLDEWAEHKESTCSVRDDARECRNPKEWLLCEDCSVGKGFCDWIKTLPYSELITGKFGNAVGGDGEFGDDND